MATRILSRCFPPRNLALGNICRKNTRLLQFVKFNHNNEPHLGENINKSKVVKIVDMINKACTDYPQVTFVSFFFVEASAVFMTYGVLNLFGEQSLLVLSEFFFFFF